MGFLHLWLTLMCVMVMTANISIADTVYEALGRQADLSKDYREYLEQFDKLMICRELKRLPMVWCGSWEKEMPAQESSSSLEHSSK
ncbi:hypothetical protein TNCV_402281 [Trichonephila clavipes]|nr:hypothetical protein TNCV_402281 [Trichonephila clavipes]